MIDKLCNDFMFKVSCNVQSYVEKRLRVMEVAAIRFSFSIGKLSFHMIPVKGSEIASKTSLMFRS